MYQFISFKGISIKMKNFFTIVAVLVIAFILSFFADIACADSFTPNIDVFPLSDLRPGMQGEVFTVVKGLERVSFPAEVISIIPSPSEPKRLILIRARGPLVEK